MTYRPLKRSNEVRNARNHADSMTLGQLHDYLSRADVTFCIEQARRAIIDDLLEHDLHIRDLYEAEWSKLVDDYTIRYMRLQVAGILYREAVGG